MNNRLKAFVLAVIFSLSVIAPVRHASAGVPLIGLAVAALGPGGTMISADILTAGVSSLIGGTIAALALSPSTADAPTRVPLLSDKPTIDGAMPPPSVPPTATQTPATSTGGTLWQFANYQQGFTNQSTCETAARAAAVQECYGWHPGDATCENQPAGTRCSSYSGTVNTPASCPTGYSVSGSSCLLQNPRAAASDGKYDLERSLSGYGGAAGEVDTKPGYAQLSAGKAYGMGRNSAGKPVLIEFEVSPDGTKTYVRHYTQDDVGGQSVINKQTLTIDAATGLVLSGNSSTSQGSLDNVGAGTVPTVNTGAEVTPRPDIVFPTDYARTGEAKAAANIVNDKLDTLTSVKPDALADPVIPDQSELTNVFFGKTFDNLLGWTVPNHASICPKADLSFTFFGKYFPLVMDTHCKLLDDVKPVLSDVMVVVWLVAALFIVLGA